MPEFVIIAFYKYCFNICFCRSTDAKWTVFDYNDKLRSSPIRVPHGLLMELSSMVRYTLHLVMEKLGY